MAPPAAYSRSRHNPALRYPLVLSVAAFVFTISSSFSSLSVVPCSAISAASSDSVLSQSQSRDDRAVLLLRGMGRRSLLGKTEDDESDSESLLLVPNKNNNKKKQQQQESTSSTTKSMKTTPPSSSSTKKSSKNQTKLIKPSSTSSGLSSSPSLSKSMSSNSTKLMKPTNLESSSEDDSSLSKKTTTKLKKLNTTSSKGSDSLKMKSTPSTKKFSSSSDLLKTSGSTNTKSQSADSDNNNKKKKQQSTSNKSKDITNDETKSKKNNSSKLSSSSSSHSSSSSSSSAKTRVKKEQTNAQKSKPMNWVFQEDEDNEDDFVSEFRDLPTRFHKTFVPDLHRISTTSKLYLSQTAIRMTRDLKPYVGHKYASTMATAVSFSFILLPLLLVSLLFNRIIRSYSSLQKILIFIHVYLFIYFSILSLSDLVTGLEPLKFFYAASRSSYVWLQVLQTLAYVFYLLLLLMYLILVFGAESGLASKFLALAQTFVGFAVGLHYYVAVFHRVVLHQPPKTNWKVHGIYALSFLLISFSAGADRRKKAYLNHDGRGEQGKNS